MLSLAGVMVSSLAGVAAGAVILCAFDSGSLSGRLFESYSRWWMANVRGARLHKAFEMVPFLQVLASFLACLASLFPGFTHAWIAAPLAFFVPPLALIKARGRYEAIVGASVDSFLMSLADALAARPNLTEALGGLRGHIDKPIQREVDEVLRDVRIGRSLDEALLGMADRLKLPGLDAAVGAALLGKKTGGDLSSIFRKMADTLREISRLEGLVRTKTAEGRAQAWVMGAVPPLLIGVLDRVDPTWLAPIWNDPVGWAMLGAASALEVIAIALIRKIVTVDI